MITDKARQLAKILKESPLENLYAHGDLLKELRENCNPTFDEFMELAGDLIYRPKDYYEIIIKRV